ncbi:MAG: hypothetical protein HYV28_08280 [Ignavibacteriales bacterium]|nr:hypothetical protein [Ignavibacteriales bacterium]
MERIKLRSFENNYGNFGARRIARLPTRQVNWLQVDPMAIKAPEVSPYNNCFNNPMRLVAPDGK